MKELKRTLLRKYVKHNLQHYVGITCLNEIETGLLKPWDDTHSYICFTSTIKHAVVVIGEKLWANLKRKPTAFKVVVAVSDKVNYINPHLFTPDTLFDIKQDFLDFYSLTDINWIQHKLILVGDEALLLKTLPFTTKIFAYKPCHETADTYRNSRAYMNYLAELLLKRYTVEAVEHYTTRYGWFNFVEYKRKLWPGIFKRQVVSLKKKILQTAINNSVVKI